MAEKKQQSNKNLNLRKVSNLEEGIEACRLAGSGHRLRAIMFITMAFFVIILTSTILFKEIGVPEPESEINNLVRKILVAQEKFSLLPREWYAALIKKGDENINHSGIKEYKKFKFLLKERTKLLKELSRSKENNTQKDKSSKSLEFYLIALGGLSIFGILISLYKTHLREENKFNFLQLSFTRLKLAENISSKDIRLALISGAFPANENEAKVNETGVISIDLLNNILDRFKKDIRK